MLSSLVCVSFQEAEKIIRQEKELTLATGRDDDDDDGDDDEVDHDRG